MRPHQALFQVLSLWTTHVAADFLSGTYPPPVDLSSNSSLVASSWTNLSQALDSYLKEGKSSDITALLEATNASQIAFSAGLFSLDDEAAETLQYHHTSQEVATAPNGTTSIDANTIYRVASVSKLITVFAGLLNLNEDQWQRPLTEYFPVLAKHVAETKDKIDPAYRIQWETTTPWALANQIAGLPQLGLSAADEVVADILLGLPLATSFPVPVPTDLGVCYNLSLIDCTPDLFLQDLSSMQPVFEPWTSPAYMDSAFMVLGLVISNVTGKSMYDVYRDSIFQPLKMDSSNSTPPLDPDKVARSVIVGNPAGNWFLEGGVTIPSGGLFSTLNDLNKLGVGILNNTLYPADLTRKWMKPHSHTESFTYSIGAPWEIIRYVHASGKISDVYTKLGDAGAYGAALAIIPEYNAGISFLNGCSNTTLRSSAALQVLDLLLDTVVPALEAQAAVEATANYVGTYTSTDPNLNSSVTIAFNKSAITTYSYPLSVTSWISNGTDALNEILDGKAPRLFPTIGQKGAGARKIAFEATEQPQFNTYVEVQKLGVGPWSGLYNSDGDFVYTGQRFYGGANVNLWVFDVNGSGQATAVTPAAAKVTLKKTS